MQNTSYFGIFLKIRLKNFFMVLHVSPGARVFLPDGTGTIRENFPPNYLGGRSGLYLFCNFPFQFAIQIIISIGGSRGACPAHAPPTELK